MSRDDAYNMTRDDVLRELELLPAWKLRELIQTIQVEKVQVEKVQVEKVQVENLEAKNLETSAIEKPTSTAAIQYEITISQDKYWAFICLPASPVDSASQGMLFNNILQALHVEKSTKIHTNNTDEKIMVAFGESTAQTLLDSQEKLESLRGKLHDVGDSKLIATYDLAHLLAYPLDKAKLWQDLCLARAYLQNLQS